MSEETKKFSAFQAFAQTQLTFSEAEEKAKQEAGAPKVDRFRTGEDGEYSVRILPLAPNFDEEGNILPMERKGYEYAVHQLFLSIKAPSKKGKTKKISIPVIRTTDKEVGLSVDLIDTYLTIAKEMYADDPALIEKITGSTFDGGIRWNYQHAMMLLDVSSDKERKKGPQIFQCSHSLYKDIDAAKMRLWKELREDGEQDTCPITGFTGAYPVKIIRATENRTTSYNVEIGRKTLDIKEEEAERLLELPRIPEQIYRYTRYQMEATIVFLQQYDEEHDMEVCKQTDFQEAVAKLAGELSPEDTSHFDLSGAKGKEGKDEGVTIQSLFDEYDAIVDRDLSERSDEYQELREKIRQFIEDNSLDVRISKSKNNLQLLEEIEDALKNQPKEAPKKEEEPKEAPKPAARRQRPAPEPEPEEEDEPKEDEADEEPAPAPVRQRRPRPVEEPQEEEAESAQEEEVEEHVEEEPQPRRRLHSRRLR